MLRILSGLVRAQHQSLFRFKNAKQEKYELIQMPTVLCMHLTLQKR